MGATGLLNKGGGSNRLPGLVTKQQAVEWALFISLTPNDAQWQEMGWNTFLGKNQIAQFCTKFKAAACLACSCNHRADQPESNNKYLPT